MKLRTITAAAVVGLLMVLPAQATYTSIQANLINANPDTSYVGGVLTVSQADPTTQLTLNDPDPTSLPGVKDSIAFNLTTTFSHVWLDGPDVKATFVGGSLSLAFNYDGSPYSIGGPIEGMVFSVTNDGSVGGTAIIGGEGLFQAAWDLPGSNDWPAPLKSSVKTLTFAFQQDLSNFDWATDDLTGNMETLVNLYPNDSAAPDPATLLLLLPGMALLRRRR